MSRLPPAQKLPLTVRKNIRDNWEARKADLESKLSDLFGVSWVVDIDPAAVFPYATEDWATSGLGGILVSYVEGAIYHSSSFVERDGDFARTEINSICHAHVLALDVDLNSPPRFSYCGCDVDLSGRLRILFNPSRFGVNISDALEPLAKALNDAPPVDDDTARITYAVRAGIRRDYDLRIGDTEREMREVLQMPDFKLNPNWDELFTMLKAGGAENGRFGADWDKNLGMLVRSYFEGLLTQLKCQKFDADDLLRDGFAEAVTRLEATIRVVDKLVKETYCEVVIEDGTLYIQSTIMNFGVNVTDAAAKLIDRL